MRNEGVLVISLIFEYPHASFLIQSTADFVDKRKY